MLLRGRPDHPHGESWRYIPDWENFEMKDGTIVKGLTEAEANHISRYRSLEVNVYNRNISIDFEDDVVRNENGTISLQPLDGQRGVAGRPQEFPADVLEADKDNIDFQGMRPGTVDEVVFSYQGQLYSTRVDIEKTGYPDGYVVLSIDDIAANERDAIITPEHRQELIAALEDTGQNVPPVLRPDDPTMNYEPPGRGMTGPGDGY